MKMDRETEDILKMATNLCQDEQEQEAEDLVKEALLRDPTNLDLLTKLGIIQARLCKDDEAEATFRLVLETNPNHKDAICSLGRLLNQSLRAEKAEVLYRNYLSRNPSSHCVVDDLCRLLLSEERNEEALSLARTHAALFLQEIDAYDALRYSLLMVEEILSGELDDNRESREATLRLLDNLVEQLTLVNHMRETLDMKPAIERDLLDEKSRIAGEIQHVFDSARVRDIPIPEDLVAKFDRLLKI
jgi:tetratricopeptide (TPR) repeat protein